MTPFYCVLDFEDEMTYLNDCREQRRLVCIPSAYSSHGILGSFGKAKSDDIFGLHQRDRRPVRIKFSIVDELQISDPLPDAESEEFLREISRRHAPKVYLERESVVDQVQKS